MNSHEFPGVKEVNTGLSMTVPDQGLSVQQIISNARRNVAMNVNLPVYTGEELLPEFNRMDKVDRIAFIQENRAEIARLTNLVKEAKAKIDVPPVKEPGEGS